jgi:hypothetical protein
LAASGAASSASASRAERDVWRLNRAGADTARRDIRLVTRRRERAFIDHTSSARVVRARRP